MDSGTLAERYFEAVQAELDQERAAVLGRYGRRVEDAIGRCRALLAAADDGDEEALAAFRIEQRAAVRAVADFCLQREVLGLTDHAWVDRIYPVPRVR